MDHCIQGFLSSACTPVGDTAALKGLKQLIPSLLGTKASPEDLAARLQSQWGVNVSMQLLHTSIWKGTSHGIGHQLGPVALGLVRRVVFCFLRC
jgi:alcohol dehydrogenase class IV